MVRAFRVLLFCCAALAAQAQGVFINEIHYDNVGTDADEGIEVAGPAGTLLADYEVHFYNGDNNSTYGSALRLSGTIPSQSGGAGAVWFPVLGIQNGPPDGMVLYHLPTATVVQRISYEGSFTPVNGVAAGQALPDIGVDEDPAPQPGQSLQLTGSGTSLAAFTWSGPRSASPGVLNAGQSFTATPVRSAVMAVLPGLIQEGAQATLQLTLNPAPGTPVTYSLGTLRSGILAFPETVTVSATGTALVPVTALTDGVADGFQEMALLAQSQDPLWPNAAAGVQVVDADRPHVAPQGALRVMSFNVRLGLGVPGSAEFNAVREVVERLSPDVLLLQEVNSANEFGDFLTLAEQAGFPAGAAYVGISGDAFEGSPYVRGDISGGQDLNVVTLSRYPITQRIQCGRGAAGRVEITRYPLLTVVDVPWLSAADDPVVANVHLKAEAGDANNFRRALEALRLRESLTAAGINAAARNVIIAGDFNATDWLPQPESYPTNSPAVSSPGTGQFADGTTLPQSFVAGADLLSPGFTLPYRAFPHSGMNPAGLTSLPLQQADGSDERTFAFASYKLDYFFVSGPVAARGAVPAEIYNSRLESLYDGIPKRRTLPAATLSTTASDHYAIVADIPLQSLPVLEVSFSRDWINEGDAGLTASVSVSPPPSEPVLVKLAAWRDGRLIPEAGTITLSAAQPVAVVPVRVPRLPGVEPHRAVSLTASAAGCLSGTGSVTVRNREAGGLLVISQYTEPVSGSVPRAMELLNVSGAALDFAVTPLHIRRYSNGGADGVVDAEATTGTLPAGAVLVVGEEETGEWMVAQGLIPAPVTPFSSQLDHTINLNAAGNAAFLLDRLVFTGNDAMEVLVDGIRSDVLGDIGHDPGTAWTGPGGESTADGTLTLRPHIGTGSSGWRQPGLRFTYQAAGDLAGFGTAPVVTDPYLVWTAAAGLSGLNAAPGSDPDRDGTVNLVEYGLMTSPVSEASVPVLQWQAGQIRRRLRTGDAALSFSLESGGALDSWSPAAGSDVLTGTFPDGGVERSFTPSPVPPGRWYFRQRVSRP